MPISTPSIQELIDQTRADFISRIQDNVVPEISNSNLDILGKVLAGGISGAYQTIEFAVNDVLFINTAVEFALNEFHAPIYGIVPGAGEKAVGNLDMTGIDGSLIPTGTALIRQSDNADYVTTADVSIVAGVAVVPIQAALVGDEFNSVAGAAFKLVSSLVGVEPNAVVSIDGILLGQDPEDVEVIRRRILDVTQFKSSGGKLSDYSNFALDSGIDVNFVWSINMPGAVLGTVRNFFVVPPDVDNSFNVIPTAGEITIVSDQIDADKPAGIQQTTLAPTSEPTVFTISGLSPPGPDSEEAVVNALIDLYQREASPNIGEAFSRQDGLILYQGVILLSHIYQAIADVVDDFTLVAPVANVSAAADAIPTVTTADVSFI